MKTNMQIMVIAKDKPNPSFLYSFLAQQEKEDFFLSPLLLYLTCIFSLRLFE